MGFTNKMFFNVEKSAKPRMANSQRLKIVVLKRLAGFSKLLFCYL